MIPKNLPPSIPLIEKSRETPAAALVVIAPDLNSICNAHRAAPPIAGFNNEHSAPLHLRQLKSEIGKRMDAIDEREAQIRNHIQDQRVMMESRNTAVRDSIERGMAGHVTGHIVGNY